LARFDNKLSSLPGTQVRIEKDYESRQKAYLENLNSFQEQHEKKLAAKLKVKIQSTEIQTNVYFDTLFGHSIEATEDILKERAEILEKTRKEKYPDDKKEIMKCWKSIELARHHYVGYAVIHGFKSLDYQDPNTGDTMLHIACRNGFADCVEELLKYKGSADMKNNKGDYPIHEVWRCWKMGDPSLSKEDRLAQEEKTCKMILSICSYGGFVDAEDITQQTALHIACRVGPIRVVKLLLSFHANITIRNKFGQTASDVAKAFNQHESYRLLGSWDAIKRHFIHTDFNVVWHKFLSNYEANMYSTNEGSNKSVEKIMQELALETNARIMQREKVIPTRSIEEKEINEKKGSKISCGSSISENDAVEATKYEVLIDDPLLQQAFAVTYAEQTYQYPKPWEKGWKTFVREARAKGVVDIQTRLAGGQAGTKLKVPIELATTANLLPRLLESKEVMSTKRKELSSRRLPPTWEEANVSWVKMKQLQEEQQAKLKQIADEELSDDEDGTNNANKPSVILPPNEGDGQTLDRLSLLERDLFNVGQPEEQLIPKFKQFLPPNSIAARRKSTACQIALDGKFNYFTTRFAHQSVMTLPIRAPQAPMMGTEEEGSELRNILSQGMEYDRLEKYKHRDKLEIQYGIIKPPKTSSLGAYCEGVEIAKYSDRDRLFDQVQKKSNGTKHVKSITEKTEEFQANQSIAKLAQIEKQPKLDIVQTGMRPRYVKSDLLPFEQESSAIQLLIRAETAKEEERLRKQLKLSNGRDIAAARADIEANLMKTQSKLSVLMEENGDDSNATAAVLLNERPPSNHRERVEMDRQKAAQKLLFAKPVVKYGTGRITSSHNMHGKIEEPWSVVTGKYQTATGDRTV